MNDNSHNYNMPAKRQILSVRRDPSANELVFLVARKVEVSKLPTCDFCSAEAKYDAKTKMGPWANMCEPHFKVYGIGLGLGKGQMLEPHRDTSYGNEKPSPTIIQQNHKPNRPLSALICFLRPVSIHADSARTKVPIFADSKILIQADYTGLTGKIVQNSSK